MLTRPDTLYCHSIDILFNFILFKMVEIDLEHVNRGSNKQRNTNFSGDEISKIFSSLINNQVLSPSDEKEYGEYFCTYYVIIGEVEGQMYKTVFCICSDRPENIGVITLFKIRGNNESL